MQRLFGLMIIAIISTGCVQNQKPAPQPGRLAVPYNLNSVPASPLPEQYIKAIMALDERIIESIYYVRHDQQRFQSGHVRIVFNLFNAQPDADVWMDWKVLYYDQDNYLIEETEWETTMFRSQVIKTIRSNSMRPDVMNFTLVIKSSPRTDPDLTKPLGFVREYEEKKAEEEARRQEELARQQAAAAGTSNQGMGQAAQGVQQMNQSIQQMNQTIMATDQLMQTIRSIGVHQPGMGYPGMTNPGMTQPGMPYPGSVVPGAGNPLIPNAGVPRQ